MANQRVGFLDLPPELRNRIYGLVGLPIDVVYSYAHRAMGKPTTPYRLLRVNRAIHSEVAPMAYGAAPIIFFSCRYTNSWLQDIGSMKRHLRIVELHEAWSLTEIESILHQLKQAKNLQVFEMYVGAHTMHVLNVARVAKVFKPFAMVMQESGCRKDGLDGALQIFRSVPRGLSLPGKMSAEEAEVDKWLDELRAEIRKLLA